MTQLIISHIEDKDLKALKPLLDRMGISYKKQVIKEIDDDESLEVARTRAGDKIASKKEQERVLRDIGL